VSRTRERSARSARSVAAAALAGAFALAAVAACGSSSGGSPASGASSSSGGVTGTITVLAASSLTEAFTTLGKQFEAAHPGTSVKFSFAASSALAEQVTQGAPADVFASASSKNMDQVTAAGDATSPTTFVKNVMEIATPPDNPKHIAAVGDLAKSGVKVALCQAQVPCGATAAKVFANAKVTVKPVTEEPDVKSVLAKVTTGEVDAGVVYVTDVRSAGAKVTGIPIPDSVNASTEYPIAALTHAPNASGAQAFVAYVVSSAGQQVLTQDGFQAP
jgi:molybdate transport system substrate-binding protein